MKHFWHRWHWYRIRLARTKVRQAETRFYAVCELVPPEEDASGTLTQAAQAAGDAQALLEDDLEILLQDRLLRSARRWGIHVPSPSDKASWDRFAYRKYRFKLLPHAVSAVREQRLERWFKVLGVIVVLASLVQAVFAVLAYFKN